MHNESTAKQVVLTTHIGYHGYRQTENAVVMKSSFQ